METILASLLWAACAAGFVLCLVQLAALGRHVARRPRSPRHRPMMSILKPLCGVDDDLEASLAAFATLDYPRYELLLGVESVRDAAYPLACAARVAWPERVRVVVQERAPGLNPKVNQLITLERHAHGEILVISDSNARVLPGYLDEMAAQLDDQTVGLVTSPVIGAGERTLGARLDNLYLSTCIGPNMIAAKRVAGRDLVVGKSMAMRRADVRALGGFECVKDVLAEDFMLGRRIVELGKRVVVARLPVASLTRQRTVGEFLARYKRWSVMQRRVAGPLVYLSVPLIVPVALALAAFAARPSLAAAEAVGVVVLLRAALDALALRALGGRVDALRVVASPLKDVLIAVAWTQALLDDTVIWRGKRLRVLAETRLELPAEAEGAPASARAS